MSEVTIPLGLLLLGTGAMVWQAVRADRERRRPPLPHPPADAPHHSEEDHASPAR